MKCFYHNDLDGICAGYWVRRHYLSQHIKEDICVQGYIPINYGTPFPFDEIEPNEDVYIVDFSISPDDMRRLLKITTNIIWIDHHKSAIEKYEDFEEPIPGLRVSGYPGMAGCSLTFLYFFRNGDLDAGIPTFTKMIADYDMWEFKYGDDTMNFVTALNSIPGLNPMNSVFDELYSNPDEEIQRWVNKGQPMREYAAAWNAKYVHDNAYVGEFDGIETLFLNIGNVNSSVFDDIKADGCEYDLYIIYNKQPNGLWKYTLYSDKHDVSKICAKYGGGGHKGAAGFVSEKFYG